MESVIDRPTVVFFIAQEPDFIGFFDWVMAFQSSEQAGGDMFIGHIIGMQFGDQGELDILIAPPDQMNAIAPEEELSFHAVNIRDRREMP
jgi:hypothetical protein